MFKIVELFFSHANEIKTCGFVQKLVLDIQLHDFELLNGDLPETVIFLLLLNK